MRSFMRVASIGALVIAAPLVISACAVDNRGEHNQDTVVITVCDLRPADRFGPVDLLTTASGAEYFIVTPRDGSGVREGLVYEIDVESSKDTGDRIVGHRQLDERAQPCP